MVIGCIILFFALLLSLRMKITLVYKENLEIYLRVLFFKIRLYPKSKKKHGPHYMSKRKSEKIWKKHKENEESKRQRRLQREQRKKSIKDRKKAVSDVLDTLSSLKELLTALVSRLFKHLKVDLARLKITVATGDAATTAVAYGAVCNAVSVLLAILEPLDGFSTPSKKDISVYADYLSESTTVDVKLTLSVRVWQALHVAITTFTTYVKQLVLKKSKQSQ